MENLKKMKECLTSKVEGQIYSNLEAVDAKELGEAVDMIKDLAEAIYYCTITEAMKKDSEDDKKGGKHQGMMYYAPRYPIEYYDPRYRERLPYDVMYASNGGSANSTARGGNNTRGGNMRGYSTDNYSMYPEDMNLVYRNGMMKDPREGKSGERRKMYMDGKGHNDKNKQIQELDAYMQELATDLTEMIQDASPEEKQLLQSKISMLAAKVK